MAPGRRDQGQPGRGTTPRRRALGEDKAVYTAVPRLRDEACFVELDPARIEDTDAAATVSAMDEHGVRVGPDDVPEIYLIVVETRTPYDRPAGIDWSLLPEERIVLGRLRP